MSAEIKNARNWHPNTFRRRKVIPDKRHRWPVSNNRITFELQEDAFVALDTNGARNALRAVH